MAGFLFLLDKDTRVDDVFESGVYSTNITPPAGQWLLHHESTLADFLSMRDGDVVFFFQKRQLYGVGRLVNVAVECKLQNFPGANDPHVSIPMNASDILYKWDDLKAASEHRWLCTFEGYPALLPYSIDMDDALSSRPHAFRSLRVMWKRSFIKMDDEETEALLDVLARRNATVIANTKPKNIPPLGHPRIQQVASKSHTMTASALLAAARTADGSIRHEMAIEAAIVDGLTRENAATTSIFGTWTYVTHQLAASPFKPVDYMDRIDVFAYRRSPPYDSITDYLVVEIKKDSAILEDVTQLMKYVDWVAQQHTGGDYSIIHAFLVAFDFDISSRNAVEMITDRGFTVGTRPTRSEHWDDLKLVRYRADGESGELEFEVISLDSLGSSAK